MNILENNVVRRWRRDVDGRADPYRNRGVNRNRQQEDSEWRRRRFQHDKFRRGWWQEKDRRRRWRLERIDWIVENKNRPLNVNDLFWRRWWHVVSHLGERGWRLEGNGEKGKAATRIGCVRSARIPPQVRPIGIRRVDAASAAPGYRLPSRGDDSPYTLRHRIVGVSSEEVGITL